MTKLLRRKKLVISKKHNVRELREPADEMVTSFGLVGDDVGQGRERIRRIPKPFACGQRYEAAGASVFVPVGAWFGQYFRVRTRSCADQLAGVGQELSVFSVDSIQAMCRYGSLGH